VKLGLCCQLVCSVCEKRTPSSELSSDSDDDDDDDDVLVGSSPAPRTEPIHGAVQVARRYSDDDRPITPMRNQMLYSMMLESHDFKDGVTCLKCVPLRYQATHST